MSILDWLFGRSDPPRRAELPGPGTFSVEIVGESYYQDALNEIAGGKTFEGVEKVVEAQLVLEDSNPKDPKAVRVDVDGRPVGYLSREVARQYRTRLADAGHPQVDAFCKAVIRGGWDRGGGDTGHFGVWLDLPVEE